MKLGSNVANLIQILFSCYNTITVVEQNINVINLENVKVNARLIETGIWETER